MRYPPALDKLVGFGLQGGRAGGKSAIICKLATVLRFSTKTLPEKCHSKCVRISYSEDSATAKRKNADSSSLASALRRVKASAS